MVGYSSTILKKKKRCYSYVARTIGLSFLLLFLYLQSAVASQTGETIVLTVKGAIGPAVVEYVKDGFAVARESRAKVIILQMDTPGGLDHSMRDIIKAILQSNIPVISYVAPDGSRAASAGTYILYASHVAAMSPATNLGAATPVQIGGVPGQLEDSKKPAEKKEEKESPSEGSTMERKMVNDAAAYIKSLANRHGRNAEWAEKAVREAVSLTAKEALELKVIDVIASDIGDLLAQVSGRVVIMASGEQVISSKHLSIRYIQQSWRNKILTVICDPNIAYILLLLGIYGLIYELANPGFVLPGVAGGISLLLALYAFQVLPINYSGLALMLLGIFFLVGEAFMPSFGALGIGGVIAFTVGSLILMKEESLRISLYLIGGTSLVSALFILWLMSSLLLMRRRKVRTGTEALIGMTGEAIDDFDETGRIWILGESWQAKTSKSLRKNEKVKVVAQEGLELTVEKIEEET